MKIVLTDFAKKRHFDPDRAGTFIGDRTPEIFETEMNDCRVARLISGYADFCKLMFVENWTNAKAGTLSITVDNAPFLRSEYKIRTDGELPVLARWLEGVEVPEAKFLVLVLYSAEQLKKEGTDIGSASWGVVAILGQDHDQEEPMPPVTAMRNALGVKEGGSGVALDREAYMRSVEFWSAHAAAKS